MLYYDAVNTDYKFMCQQKSHTKYVKAKYQVHKSRVKTLKNSLIKQHVIIYTKIQL